MRRRLSILPLFLFLFAVPAGAQTEAAPAEPAFGEVIDVRLINLEVVVTDGKERVEGLAAGDFRLLVDGGEVPIEYFTEVRDGSATTAAGARAPDAVAPGGAVGTSYLLFIDDYFAIAAHRDQLLDRLAGQLTVLGPEDRMAVVAFDGRRVEMLSNWTASRADLAAALEAAKSRRAYGLQRRAEERLHDERKRQQRRDAGVSRELARAEEGETEGETGEPGLGRLPAEDLERSWEVATQVKRAVYGAASALRAFGRPPGRKVMLLMSGGWPASPASWVVGSLEAAAGEAQLTRGSALLRPLVDAANLLGYTLYPIDVGRRGGDPIGAAEVRAVEDAEVAARLAADRDRVEESALLHLAAATGGRAFLDGASFEALARTAEDTRSYYWLGFSPAWQGDDERHRVAVEVRREGLETRARTGFSDLSRRSEVTLMVESAQLLDLPVPGWESSLVASLGEPEPAGFRKVAVPLRLTIPLDRVTFAPSGEGVAARLELRVAATDDEGNTAEIPVIPVAVEGRRAPQPGEVGVFETSIRLRRRPHKLLLALYDPPSGEMLSTRLDFEPGGEGRGGSAG